MSDVDKNHTIWKNTVSAFKRQFTQIDKLIADAKQAAKDLADPSHKMNGKEAKKLVEPLQRKLGLVNNYINSLHNILPLAAVTENEGTHSVERLSATLDKFLDRAKGGNQELTAFLEAIEEWELHQKKDTKDTKKGVTGGTVGDTKPLEIKGVATALKPEELTSSIAAHDMSVWVEQWNEFKENSAFSRQGENSIIAYLKTCVWRDILSAIDYKTLKTEKEMLDAIQAYLDTKVHPKVIRQLEIWQAKQGSGSSVAESMRRQVCQFYDTNMEKNEVEDWLKLLLYTTCQDKELLSKILARARTLKTAHDVIDYVEAEECGKLNKERLLGGKAIVARVQGKQGKKGAHCYACQNPGHIRSECTVEKSKLYCQHCKK